VFFKKTVFSAKYLANSPRKWSKKEQAQKNVDARKIGLPSLKYPFFTAFLSKKEVIRGRL
jgi:hypothetical protein